MADREYRVPVRVPRPLKADFAEITKRRGHVQAQLLFSWAHLAMIAAKHGHHDLLPPNREWAITDDWAVVRWKQGKEEITSWIDLIKGAGSSLRGCIHAAMSAYVEVDGVLAEMPQAWRPCPGEPKTPD